jgi:carboxyl-terminal processing protease
MKYVIINPLKSFFIIATIGILTSCEEALIGPVPENDPETNFEEMWKGCDQYYGLFGVKNVDWQASYATYRPLVSAQTTDAELKSIFHHMIDPLNDNHTYIITTENEPRIESGIFDTLKVQTDFSLDLIPAYVPDFTHYGAAIDYGTLTGNIGYIHLGDFIPSQKYFGEALDQILEALEDTEGLVIDIRDNPGGNDVAAQYVAGRFAAERKLYMTVRKKSGPGPHDFTQAIPWYVEPTGGTRYTRPIVLLTSRWTQSAGETFCLAMQELAHVTQLGDYTSGAFSDNISRELPNGWFCFMSIGDYRAANGQSYEGIGVKPDEVLVNTKEEILSGKDKVLEKAMELL